ncbi:GNAT family N-acetyltransferase [Leisingera sp. F5]|uniref:GNAT family N-acetyltransferase n=1 Tax=Leisingera sp. F5 TaxID=1813816 RepID=UPI000A91D4CC|nr:GNAT family N-acetyltransferase [Leisingera sp. F5]
MEETSLPLNTSFGSIREAELSDAEEILRMVERMAAHHDDTSTLQAGTLARDVFSDNPWVHLLVAEAESRLAGYAALCGLAQLQFGVRGFDVHHLFTEAGFRRRGAGTNLVRASIHKSKSLSCKYLSVGTHPDNLEAQAFYASLGFKRREAFPPRFVIRLEE